MKPAARISSRVVLRFDAHDLMMRRVPRIDSFYFQVRFDWSTVHAHSVQAFRESAVANGMAIVKSSKLADEGAEGMPDRPAASGAQ